MHTLGYILNLVFMAFSGWIAWVFFQLTLAAWGHARAKEKWIALAKTPFMQLVGIRWISVIALVGTSMHFLLLVLVFVASLILGRPIVLDS